MGKTIKFTKMHGAGNDYIYVNTLIYNIEDPAMVSKLWSRSHFAIGSDGLILIGKADDENADFSMRIFNNDGSEGKMCGNGARCVARYLHDKGLTDKTDIRLQTLAGIKILHLNLDAQGEVENVTVDMDAPVSYKTMKVQYPGTFVSMGNPHFVIFVDDVENFPVDKIGPTLEHDAQFPDGCNIEFAQVLPDRSIRMRVWERGSGITMACGTGACATAVAAYLTERAARESQIRMDGGTLQIRWDENTDHVFMTGPAEIAFEGEICYPER